MLLVEDDEGTLSYLRDILATAGYRVWTARTGAEARGLIEQDMPDIALIDLRLPDESGVELLRLLRSQRAPTVCVIVTGYSTCRSTVDAMRLGALDVIEKPLYGDALLDLVRRAAAALRPVGACEQHALGRWAAMVLRGVGSPSDPRTLAEWGRAVGASRGSVRNWCNTAGVSPGQSLLFTRLLRAVIRHERTHAGFEQLLDVVDRRTLIKLRALCGGSDGAFPRSVDVFLAQQQVVTERAAVAQIVATYHEALARVDSVSMLAS